MKKSLTRIFLMMPIAFCFSSQAQNPLACGNGEIHKQAFTAALQYEQKHFPDHTINRGQAVNYLVRVYFHVFNNDDGTQTTASATVINAEFTTLQASYAADAVCFLNAGIEFVNSTALNQNFNADNDKNGLAFDPFRVPGCINIFYVQKINGNNTACTPPCGYGGYTFGIPSTSTSIATGNVGDGGTISHEVGHCLGLLHTFEKNNGFENINGSNSATSADLITDTPADPFAYNGQPCYATNGCFYTGACTDPNNQANFSPPYSNLMAYWYNLKGKCTPSPFATNGQFVRVNSFLNSNTGLINSSSPLNTNIGAMVVSSGYYMNSAINTLSTSGTVIINASAIATLGGGTITLEPGFHANPQAGGMVKMEIRTCN